MRGSPSSGSSAGRGSIVAGGNAKPGTAASSSYSVTIHVHHGGFYRVRVLPVEGGHVTGYGPATLVRVAGSL